MNNQKSTKKLAKLVFTASLVNNKIDESKLKKLISLIKKGNPKKSLLVLLYLEKLIQKKLADEQLLIESAYLLEPNFETQIKNKFEKMLNKKLTVKVVENKELIAGVRIKNANYIWENSVLNNFEQLKTNLINE
jgi:F0F1-type ATP synthase delta subunit